jgi:hypothetical protein
MPLYLLIVIIIYPRKDNLMIEETKVFNLNFIQIIYIILSFFLFYYYYNLIVQFMIDPI